MSRRRLVLAGGGHAQIHVLEDLARRTVDAADVTLVSPSARVTYTGMIPGALAGLYAPEDAAIDVAALAARCGARFVMDRVTGLRPAERLVELERHGALAYDVLALDVGAQPQHTAQVRGFAHVVPIKPIEDALPRIAAFLAAAERTPESPAAIVVGAGAGGVEVAFALRKRLGAPGSRVSLLERGATLLAGVAPRLRTLVARLATRAGIDVRLDAGEVAPSATGVTLGDGTAMTAGLVVWATGAEGLPFVARSGLRCDARGFAVVDDFLRCTSAPEIFAAGDCSVLASAPWVPRAGVYAVRQGPVLARNVAAALAANARLTPFRPQRRFLKLLSTADRRAILSYGPLALHGSVWWGLKDRIDRRFVARFTVRA